jgi:hypothetical protein
MRIRQTALEGFMASAPTRRTVTVAMCVATLGINWCSAQTVAGKGAVVTLPGIRASADAPGCTEANGAGTVALSFDCLNRAVAPTNTLRVPVPQDADVSHRATNQLGLYNAAALGHRMGPNLGTSVQPYRPRLTYPAPLVPAR